ncbi:superoxide dismutase [bacterium]|nr:MAG: superoxide dismutase [bacterium]RKZ13730.1 MAG: superoxide dismutase [bacterium]
MIKNLAHVLLFTVIVVVGPSLFGSTSAQAHCEIPCGIYDDHARVSSMLEDAATVEKSARLIGELSGKVDAQSQNQLVRWVMNKEQHSQSIIDTISNYFLTQRVKASQDDYSERLAKHHAVIVAAMKAKQQSGEEYARELRQSIEALAAYYPEHEE